MVTMTKVVLVVVTLAGNDDGGLLVIDYQGGVIDYQAYK